LLTVALNKLSALKKYKHISVYFFCYFFNAAVSFGVVSLLTHYLTTEDYGIVNLYSVLLSLLLQFVTGGVLQTLNVEFFKKSKKEYAEFFTAALAIPVISTVLLTLLALVLTGPLSRSLKVDAVYIWIIPLLVFCLYFQEFIAALTRNRGQHYLFASFSIGKNILEAGFSLLFVLTLHQSFNGRINAIALSSIILLLMALFALWKWGFFTSFSGLSVSKQILLLSAPLMVDRISIFVISSSDRYFINHYVNTSEVGLYGVGGQIATIANLTLLSMNNFFHPYIFRTIKNRQDGNGGNVKKAVLIYAGVSAVAIALVLIATPFIFAWFIGPDFQSGRIYALMLTSAYLPWAIYQSVVPILLFEQQNRYIMLIAVTSILFSLLSNFILVPLIGAKGAVITLFLVNSLMATMAIVRIKTRYSSIF
jgi:O-antigen/teichoic acid export membrane protein